MSGEARKAAIAAALVLALGLGAVAVRRHARLPAAPPGPPVAAAGPVSLMRWAPIDAPRPPPARAPATPASPRPDEQALGNERAVLCAAASVGAAAGASAPRTAGAQGQTERAWHRVVAPVVAGLGARDDVRSHALAAFLTVSDDADARRLRRDAVAREAAQTSDPVAYELALQLCMTSHELGASSACDGLSVAHWATLDSGNAVPWLMLAQQAQQRGDRQGLYDALYHVSVATRDDPGTATLPDLLLQALPPATPAWQRGLLVEAMLGVSAAFFLPGYLTPLQACTVPGLADANRRQLCEALAKRMLDGGMLMEQDIGIRLGERLGWEPARLARLHADQQLLLHAQADASANLHACDAPAEMEELAADLGRLGERRWAMQRARADAAQAAGEPAPAPATP